MSKKKSLDLEKREYKQITVRLERSVWEEFIIFLTKKDMRAQAFLEAKIKETLKKQ